MSDELHLHDEAPPGYRRNAGVVLVATDGRVFAGQRADQGAPAWQMPQGGIDGDETVVTAALRELEEETGVGGHLVEVLAETPRWLTYDLPPDLAQNMWRGRFRGQAQKWVALRFLGRDADVDLERHHPEFKSWAWLHAAEIEGRIVPFKRAAYRYVLRCFERYLAR